MISPETWTLAVAILTGTGLKETVTRALIGRQCRDWEEADVVTAYERASGKVDPRTYAAGILQRTKKRQRKAQDQLPLTPETPPADREIARQAISRTRAILARRSGT